MNKEEITFDIPNYAIPREIKDICKECENNIHCQNKGCAFRSLGNEYCDVVLNATKLYLKLQQENQELKEELEELKHKHYLIQGGRGHGKTYLLHLQQENKQLKEKVKQLELNRYKAIEDLKYYQYKAYDEENDVRYDEIQSTIDILKEVE